ncbi:hypothetical protein BLS_009484 [Venturia inaequalis]|uniref:DUF7029 domain-containing protein n=1 Tax=Venturia inaequalis TaxID=5025 RepID=A0A8H3U3L1_VENIN|nr:hypothetical protein BLS_009484 [Venturia inaequalis]
MHPALLLFLGATSTLALPHSDYNLPPPSNSPSPSNSTSRSNPKSSLTVTSLASKGTPITTPIAGSCGKNGIATVTVTKTEASRPSVAYSGSKSSSGAGSNVAGHSGSQSSYEFGGHAAGISEHIEHTGPIETLRPVVHWNVDTKPAQNIIPVATGNGCPQYYAQGANTDPKKAHIFGTMTYFYKSPAVNLDYADHASSVSYTGSSLVVTIGSQLAYMYAQQSWTVGMILNTHTTDCGGEVGKGCYWTVTSLSFQAGSRSIICGGSASQIENIIHSGEAEWGVYEPARDGNGGFGGFGSPSGSGKASNGTGSGSSSGSTTTSTATLTSPSGSTSSPASSLSSGSRTPSASSSTASNIPSASNLPSGTNSTLTSNGTLASNSTLPQTLDSFGPNATVCQGPKDTKYGLPTACLGNLFDLELDTRLGFQGQSTEFQAWLDTFAPGNDDGNIEEPSFERRSIKTARRLSKRDWLSGAINWVAKKTTQAVTFVQELKKKVGDATSIPGDFTTNMAFQVPKAAAPAEGKVIESPWGNSILLKAFGTQGTPETAKPLTGYLNVFCVDCGAKGSAQLTGKAAFSPLTGFTKGELGMIVDLDVVLKLGIDAQLQFKKEFTNTLFELGLPGLDFAVVKVGPMVSLGSAVTLEAAAKGRILAGAEFGLKKAKVTLDIMAPSKSTQSGWTPYFQPVFQAEGEIMLAAELGLPIGLKCGITVLSFKKSVAIYDQPAIKAQAEVAASVGLTGANTLAAGFKSTNGCTGISTQISWRNKIWVDVLDLKTFDVSDSGYHPLVQGCIELPGVPASVAPVDGEPSATPSDTPTDLDTDPTATPTPDPVDAAPITADPVVPADPAPIEKRSTQTLHFPKLQYNQAITPRQTTNTPTSQNTTSTILDLTARVVTNITNIDYIDIDIKPAPYNRTDGYDNGNVYVQGINGTTPDVCSDLWGAREDVTSTDGNSRVMHYFKNTMDVVGVSRLRVSTEDLLPKTAVPIVLAPFDVSNLSDGGDSAFPLAAPASTTQPPITTSPLKRQLPSNSTTTNTAPTTETAADETSNILFFAIDPTDTVFFTTVCTYIDHQVPRLFLVKDIDAGMAMLQSADVEFSVTGGLVDTCFAMPLIQGSDAAGQYDGLDVSAGGDSVGGFLTADGVA